MDYQKAMELSNLANEQVELAREYCKKREAAGNADKELGILLSANIKGILKRKAGAGYDMAVMMLMEENEEAKKCYAVKMTNEARYKGLEKLIETLQSKISLEQSIMKYILRGEQYGG